MLDESDTMNDEYRPVSGTDIDARIAELSPEKRALLLKRIGHGSKDPGRSPVLCARTGERSFEPSFALLPIVALSRAGDLPLSFAQQRLWFLDRLLPDQGTYNIPTVWRLQGPLDAQTLQRSVDGLVARHETLRTRFVLSDGQPAQIIEAAQSVALPMIDLSAMPQAGREARAREIAEADARQPFNLETGPLLRTQLLRLAPDEHLLLLNVHHIASDGWSTGIFERELSSASMPTTQRGSASGCRVRCWRPSSPTGRPSSRVWPPWSCRPIGRARRRPATKGRISHSTCPRH